MRIKTRESDARTSWVGTPNREKKHRKFPALASKSNRIQTTRRSQEAADLPLLTSGRPSEEELEDRPDQRRSTAPEGRGRPYNRSSSASCSSNIRGSFGWDVGTRVEVAVHRVESFYFSNSTTLPTRSVTRLFFIKTPFKFYYTDNWL